MSFAEWNAVVTVDEANDLWMVECFLPFSSFGGKVPEKGSFWEINIIRNYAGKSETCGFPACTHPSLHTT